ncbi:MAG: hypothetical protein JWL68_3751 [Actinomycetia bacterium]|jgi:hypothetical protein|nr:hypothetical protein [Actinomycetes bacterium]
MVFGKTSPAEERMPRSGMLKVPNLLSGLPSLVSDVPLIDLMGAGLAVLRSARCLTSDPDPLTRIRVRSHANVMVAGPSGDRRPVTATGAAGRAEPTGKGRANDQGPATVGGDRACDLLLHE